MNGSPPWQPVPPGLRASPEHVDVWRCDLTTVGNEAELLGRLTPVERARAEEYRVASKRREFIVARSMMRAVLGRLTQCEPLSVTFAYEAKGKPLLDALSNTGEVTFNLSHSQGMILMATAARRAVGIDVECVRERFSFERLAERFFSPREVATLMGVPEAQRMRAFYLCWTRKEAYLKAMGLGITVALDSFDTVFWPASEARIEASRDEPDAPTRWAMNDLPLGDEHVGTVVVEGPGAAMRCWEMTLV
ncbi:MAG: 4'-phosphopantetheinyl transferase superfamily protein [Phycisphaeraceae bacterium]